MAAAMSPCGSANSRLRRYLRGPTSGLDSLKLTLAMKTLGGLYIYIHMYICIYVSK